MEIQEKEIKDAISQCGRTKSPRLNGFNFYFIEIN